MAADSSHTGRSNNLRKALNDLLKAMYATADSLNEHSSRTLSEFARDLVTAFECETLNILTDVFDGESIAEIQITAQARLINQVLPIQNGDELVDTLDAQMFAHTRNGPKE